MDKVNERKEKLNLETARIAWKVLERFFARGVVLAVAESLDLTEVACAVSEDNKAQMQSWLKQGLVAKVSDQQAIEWHNQDAELWSVVVRPWVLVQNKV